MENLPTALRPAQPRGFIDKASGLILPVLDRFIEIEDIKKTTGRDLTPRPVTGLVGDPNPEQVFATDTLREERLNGIRNVQKFIPPLVVGGLVLVAAFAAVKALRK